jgi:lysophospholipase L1-like esterase
LAAWFALIMIVKAAPPLPWDLIAVFFVVFMTRYARCNSSSPPKILRIGSTLILGVLIVCGTALEYPHRRLPDLTGGARQSFQVRVDDRVVPVELGGNDLIAGPPSDQFERSLDSILSRLAFNQRTVEMMELPLLPQRIGYGRAQRRLASKCGVWLIPKRYFVQVISGSSATSDGLHLSGEGARRMAKLMARVLSPVLRNP